MTANREGMGMRIDLGEIGEVRGITSVKGRVYFFTADAVYFYDTPTRWGRFKQWLKGLATPARKRRE